MDFGKTKYLENNKNIPQFYTTLIKEKGMCRQIYQKVKSALSPDGLISVLFYLFQNFQNECPQLP